MSDRHGTAGAPGPGAGPRFTPGSVPAAAGVTTLTAAILSPSTATTSRRHPSTVTISPGTGMWPNRSSTNPASVS